MLPNSTFFLHFHPLILFGMIGKLPIYFFIWQQRNSDAEHPWGPKLWFYSLMKYEKENMMIQHNYIYECFTLNIRNHLLRYICCKPLVSFLKNNKKRKQKGSSWFSSWLIYCVCDRGSMYLLFIRSLASVEFIFCFMQKSSNTIEKREFGH